MRNRILKFSFIVFLCLTVSCNNDNVIDPVNGVSFTVEATQAHTVEAKFVYQLDVTAKDSARGNVLWANTFILRNNDQVYIPLDYPFYSFKASQAGAIPHYQFYDSSELIETNSLAFEFLPESLAGLCRVYPNGVNGGITFYLPDVVNRCRLYARADFAEGYKPLYVYGDQNAIDISGYPVADLVWTEWLGEIDKPNTTGYPRVNLHGNKPFNQTANFCEGIDFTASRLAPTIKDVDISCYLVSSVFYEKKELFDDIYRKWKGQNNP